MAEAYRMFAGGSYNAAKVAEEYASFLGGRDGVFKNEDNELACTASGADLNVAVDTGQCGIQGYWGQNDASQNIAMVPDGAQPRINRVIAQLDLVAKTIDFELLAGTPGAVPVAPALTRAGNVWEISLCQVYVAAAAGTIAQTDITNERQFIGDGAATGEIMTNDGTAVVYGDTVVVDVSGNRYFNKTTTARDLTVVGVCGESEGIANGATGLVLTHGECYVNVDAATTRGNWLRAGTTSAKAAPTANPEIGVFARALETTAGSGQARSNVFGPIPATATGTANCIAAYNSAGKIAAAQTSALSQGAFVWHFSGVVATGSSTFEYAAPYAVTLTGGYIISATAPTGCAMVFDVHSGAGAGTTVFTTQANRPTLADESAGPTAIVAPDVTAIGAGTRLFCVCDTADSNSIGADVTVILAFTAALV